MRMCGKELCTLFHGLYGKPVSWQLDCLAFILHVNTCTFPKAFIFYLNFQIKRIIAAINKLIFIEIGMKCLYAFHIHRIKTI